MRISAFTVCLPEYSPKEAASKLAEWGYNGVEWRIHVPPLPGEPVKSFWQGNRASIDPQTIVEEVPELRKICQKKKLSVPVLATYLKYNELDLIERVMEAGSFLGVKGVRVQTEGYDGSVKHGKLLTKALKGFDKVARLAEKYRLKALIEIHHKTIFPSASSLIPVMERFSHSEVGFIHDAGNMIAEGYENWQMGMEILGKYMAHVHVKNMSYEIVSGDKSGNLHWESKSDTLRHGRVDWAEILRALKKVGYKGWLSMEDFYPGKAEDKLPGNIKYIRSLLKAL